MMKINVFAAIIFSIIFFAQAQSAANTESDGTLLALSPTFGMSPSKFFQDFVIQAAATKLINVTLPLDLEVKVANILANSETGFSACDKIVSLAPFNWRSKKCAIDQFKNVVLQLAAVEREALLRNATLSSTTMPTPVTELLVSSNNV